MMKRYYVDCSSLNEVDEEHVKPGTYERIVVLADKAEAEIKRLRRNCIYYINEARAHRWAWRRHSEASTQLLGQNTELMNEVERLRGAIEQHRDDMWGDDPISHDIDKELYAALGGQDES